MAVVRLFAERLDFCGTNDLEIVVRIPEQMRGHQNLSGRFNVRLLIPCTDQQVCRGCAQLTLYGDLEVHRSRLFVHRVVVGPSRVISKRAFRSRSFVPGCISAARRVLAFIDRPKAKRVGIAAPCLCWRTRCCRIVVIEQATEVIGG
jgi:hypothetical protein